MLKRTSD